MATWSSVFLAFLLVFSGPAAHGADPPLMSWIDSETDRRVIKLSREPYASLPYFTANVFSSDKRSMVYQSAKGLHLVDLDTFGTTLLVPAGGAELHYIEVGRRSNRVFYLHKRRNEKTVTLRSTDRDTKTVTEHARLPLGHRIESINADETLAVGIREETPSSALPSKPFASKGEILYERVNAKIPMALFTVSLHTGKVQDIYQSTDWLSHPQFSPTDASLLMYSHEGPWHQVDRIWTIRTDGTQRTLVHKRSQQMEITGHEVWSSDGRFIHYDWQRPKGENFYLASYEVASGERTARALTREQWSIHFSPSTNPLLLAGDGADPNQVSRSDTSAAIFLYRLAPPGGATDAATAAALAAPHQPITTEKLVDLRAHDYRLEPNARLTPDNRWVVFRSNLFGVPSVYAVQVEKSAPGQAEKKSTFELAKALQAQRRAILMTD